MTSVRDLINHLETKGADASWQELARKYNIKNKDGKVDWRAAVAHWSNHKRKLSKTIGSKMPRIFIFDIETTSLEARVWSLWNQNVSPINGQLKSEYKMICWSGKWLFDDNIMSECCTKKEMLAKDDSRIVKKLHKIFDEADIIVAHYGDAFDIKMSNTRFLMNGLLPPSPYKTIDTKKVASKHFRFESNKLDYIGYKLGLGRKIKTDYALWDKCQAGSKKALKRMAKYCDQDVLLLEQVYLALRPYMKNHPNLNIYDEQLSSEHRCPSCMSDKLTKSGTYVTKVSTFDAYKCNSCGSVSRVRKSNKKNKPKLVSA